MRKKLTKAARCAIKMRNKEQNRSMAIKNLQEDIYNGPFHCFGLHQACSPDYCKVAESKLTSVVTVAQSTDSSLESTSIALNYHQTKEVPIRW